MSQESQDTLLRQLARLAAERDREEEAAESEPRLAAARRPLDAAARARIVAHLEEVVAEPPRPAPLLRFPRRLAPRFALPLAALLVAMVSALVYRALLPGESGVGGPGALPEYSLRVEGGLELERGGEGESPRGPEQQLRMAPGNRLQVVATPDLPVASELAARAYLSEAAGGVWKRVDPAYLAVSAQGAVRLDAVLGTELPAGAGSWRLLLVVGELAALPTAEEAARTGGGGEWRAFLFRLEIGEPP